MIHLHRFKMKFKTFTSLALAAILTAWVIVASAQSPSNGLTLADNPFETLSHDCVSTSVRGEDVLNISPFVVATQSFKACSNGELNGVYLEIHSVNGAGNFSIVITGNGLYHSEDRYLAEGDNGLIQINTELQLIDGMEYLIKMMPTEDLQVNLWSKKFIDSEDELILDGWTLNGTVNFGVGIDGMIPATSPVNNGRTPEDQYDPSISKPDNPKDADDLFLVYPNPFHSDCNVSFDQPLRGHTQITLSDTQGNTRYSTGRSTILDGETINVQPDAALEPGIYVLRVLNDGKVYHKTIMKN